MEENMFYGAGPFQFRKACMLRQNLTEAESKLWSRIRKKQLLGVRFKAQHPIHNYIVDFYCHKVKLVIEVDGGSHERKQQILSDRIRSELLMKLGIHELRFSNNEVEFELDSVLETIRHCVNNLLKQKSSE
jgi:very-short-patch-repair endonuclease